MPLPTPTDEVFADVRAYLQRKHERIEIEHAPCQHDVVTAVADDGSCLRCEAEQHEVCR